MSMNFKDFRSIQMELIEDTSIYLYGGTILSEEVHQQIQDAMDSLSIEPKDKLRHVVRIARSLIASGQDTGLESAVPKTGSSRAVFFPKQPKTIILDGKEVHVPTAVKIAFPGQLDRYTGDQNLLGEHQNRAEHDRHLQQSYGIIREIGPNQYETNPNGVLMPVFSGHSEGHYIECGKCDAYNAKDLREYTKMKGFSRGIDHKSLQNALIIEHMKAHGASVGEHDPKILQHPHYQNMENMVLASTMHPSDLSPRNMGIWKHPITGVAHPVVLDYGFNNQIAKLYATARKNMMADKKGH